MNILSPNPFTTEKENDNSSKTTYPDPCILTIFGATGDLTSRKLLPALQQLHVNGRLPEHFACVGFARREKTHEQFRSEVKEHLLQSLNKQEEQELFTEEAIDTLCKRIYYHQSTFEDQKGYQDLREFLEQLDEQLGTKGNRLYYFSTPPSHFPPIIENLYRNHLLYRYPCEQSKWSRVVIEKPFGHDYESALELDRHLRQYLSEEQIYRIDHYLAKEKVQNLLVFRFANPIFESVWNNQNIEHVQITVAEDIGIGSRGRFFEESGLLRDIVQNHLIQLLCLVGMEAPVNLEADSIRDEKLKVLKAIRPFDDLSIQKYVVAGQYTSGVCDGVKVKSYREEDNVAPDSQVETFAALKLFIDNWRWNAVPFYLRAGKRLPKRVTEIAIYFKDCPPSLFSREGRDIKSNQLLIQIQPDAGINLSIQCKAPGLSSSIETVKMQFAYSSAFSKSLPSAYERLLYDCMCGDSTLFTRGDEVLEAWKLIDPILKCWSKPDRPPLHEYPAGTWGPKEAMELHNSKRHCWRKI